VNRVVLLVALTFGAFLVAHLASTAMAALALPAVRGRHTASARARLALALRLLPTASAVLAALLVGVSFARHEPPNTAESAGPVLLIAGGLGAWLVLLFTWRAMRSLALTSCLFREWERRARPLALPRAPAPARRLEHDFPVVAVVGVLRPRLFVAGSVLDRLSASELRAVLEHEKAHVERRDNLKRWLARSCPDLPWLGGPGERLRRAWEEASEQAADDRAARRGRRAASRLASALVKVAQLTPRGARLSVSAIALLSESNLRGRVEALLSHDRSLPSHPAPIGWIFAWLAPALIALAVVGSSSPLRTIHVFLEAVVRALS
jgi:beta-lactamase regulating signal transducer with metallopeptidase domain